MKWVLAKLPNKPKSIVLLFSNSVHGWKVAYWRSRCIGHEHTLTFMRSSKGKVAGGNLHIKWQENGDMATDDKTFLISVDHRELLKPVDASKAVYFVKALDHSLGEDHKVYVRQKK